MIVSQFSPDANDFVIDMCAAPGAKQLILSIIETRV